MQDLDQIENEIDQVHQLNPIFELSFEEAAGYLLTAVEDQLFESSSQDRALHDAIAEADNYVNALRYPLEWIKAKCERGGQLSVVRDATKYRHACELLLLALRYNHCTTIFPMARKGTVNIEVDHDRLTCQRVHEIDYRYEAYNRIAQVELRKRPAPDVSKLPFDKLLPLVEKQNEGFHIKWNHSVLREFTSVIGDVMSSAYTLNKKWQFSQFSIEQFQQVYSVLSAISFCWRATREQLKIEGSTKRAENGSLVVFDTQRLIALVNRTTRIKDKATVASIIRFLTYGELTELGLNVFDPALQPLIPVSSNDIAIAPYWFSSLSPERNLTVLLNQVDCERAIYSVLTADKEPKMVSRIEQVASNHGWMAKSGFMVSRKKKLELDIGLVDPKSRVVLLTELKWLIEPAEMRETRDRLNDLRKGIAQCRKRMDFLRTDESAKEWMGIDDSYDIFGCLVSANWIGDSTVQSDDCPIICEQDLLKRLGSSDSLRDACEWLSKRDYLPVENEDFRVKWFDFPIGRWEMNWYGIKALV